MLGLRVTVPIACFRKALAREYLETEVLPPPATCYGFLLSLVGETDRRRHVGVRVTASLLKQSEISTVLRTVWRVKSLPLGTSGNTRPDYQQLLTHVELVVWLDAGGDSATPNLERRVVTALDSPEQIERFGGLSLGESTHLVDEVSRLPTDDRRVARTFLLRERGRMTLPVWVDHVGSRNTRYVTGDLCECPLAPPAVGEIPEIQLPD